MKMKLFENWHNEEVPKSWNMPTGAGGKVLTGRRLSSADSYFFFKFICS
jgi:hypothetical protein